MGLFNSIFGDSTKKQGVPVRDKFKDRKHFERMLKRTSDEIEDVRNSILDAKRKGGDIDPFLYYIMDDRNMDIIQIKYSMGARIKELQEIYIASLKYFLLDKEPVFYEISKRVSLGILLNIPNKDFKQLVDHVRLVDKQEKTADWTPDLLLWFILNSRLKEEEKQTYAQKLAFPKSDKGLYKVTQTTNAEMAKKTLKEYLEKWYSLNKDAPWYNSHLKKNCYLGYWAWEVAAVAKVMHIDDTDLKENPYYPYDMVHWEDCEENKER